MRHKTSHYDRERKRGRTYSAILHFCMLLLAIFGLPEFLSPKPVVEPMAISVEILPTAAISNVKPAEKPPAPEEKPEPKKAEQKKPSPPVKSAQETPPPPKEAVPLPEEKKPEKKAEEKKPEVKKDKPEEKKADKKKPKEDPLAAVLKAVKDTAQNEKKDNKKDDKKPVEDSSPNKSISDRFDPNMQMSLSEKDAIKSQISKCWNVPAGAKDAQNLIVVIHAEYAQDGSVIKAEVARESMSRYNSDTFYRAAADSAVRAVLRCTPLTGLAPDKYDGWKQMELSFDPKEMLN